MVYPCSDDSLVHIIKENVWVEGVYFEQRYRVFKASIAKKHCSIKEIIIISTVLVTFT